MRVGLRAKFVWTLVATMAVFGLMLGLVSHSTSQVTFNLVEQGSKGLQDQAKAALAERGTELAGFLADALTNPVYYFDLLTIRELARSTLRQPDVEYVIVFDAQGRVMHDGSPSIPSFGQVMSDPLAPGVIAAAGPLVQWNAELVEASVPIQLAGERIGGVRIGLSAMRAEQDASARGEDLRRQVIRTLAGPAHILALTALIMVVWVAAAGWLVARGLVRPIRTLANSARAIEEGRYEVLQSSRRGDELGDLIRAFARMSSAVRQHQEDVRQLAYQDHLTGLPNRRMLRELLDELVADYQERKLGLALLFIDLDDFKRINDTLGHDVGDEVIDEFARRVRQALPESAPAAPILARLGGDEFVALITAQDPRLAGEAAARSILAALHQPFAIGGKSLLVGASIGITVYPDDAQSAKLLLKHGDLAMYQAKRQGKNCYRFFVGHLTEAAEQRLLLEHELRAALDRGGLELAYQPIHDVLDGRIVGCEALLRWQHPERGWIPPAVFVPIAETTGLITALGDFVLDRACRDAQSWQASAPGVSVAVNVSARQLQHDDLGLRVAAALQRHGLAAELLHLELTESSLLHDEQRAFDALARLRDTGVRVWLDDFGTGFSGLSHLRRARVDGVKIDRSFIADILSDPEDLALASAIIAMAHSLGMQVIAEGVEVEAQWRLLRERGCDQAQGFWLAKPVAASAVPELAAQAGLNRRR